MPGPRDRRRARNSSNFIPSHQSLERVSSWKTIQMIQTAYFGVAGKERPFHFESPNSRLGKSKLTAEREFPSDSRSPSERVHCHCFSIFFFFSRAQRASSVKSQSGPKMDWGDAPMTMLEIGIEEDLHDYDDTLTFERIHDPQILKLFQQNF